MVAVSEVLKCVVNGKSVSDTWSWAFWIQCANPVSSGADLATLCTAWDTHANSDTTPSAYTQAAALLSTDQSITHLSMYYYSDPSQPALLSAQASRSVAGTGTFSGPLQAAMAVTLNTGQAGARHRGRVYLPVSGISYTAHAFSNGNMQTAALAVVDFMDAALSQARASDPGDASRVVVMSRKGGYTTPITGVSIDNRPDIIRARANKQAATRTSYTGPNP